MKGKRILILSLILVMAIAGFTVASAGFGTTDSKIFTVAGTSFENWSSVYTTSTTARATSSIQTYNYNTLPMGHMGAQARLYHVGTTAAISDTGMEWTKAAARGITASTPTLNVSPGYYYSQGTTQVYNGSNYTSEPTYRTPNVYTN